LREEVRRHGIERLKAMLEELSPVLEKISVERIVESVREDREAR